MTIKRAALITALAVAAGLSACATATPYQPQAGGQHAAAGGFTDLRLEQDR